MSAEPTDRPVPHRPTILTWRAPDASAMESVRVQLSGNRIRANGKIIAAATAARPAFSAYYDLQTDESGATSRFGLTVTLAERERQLALARDRENMWLVADHRGQTRAGYGGALDVDVVFSAFFNALPIRRLGLHRRPGEQTLPMVYVGLPELTVTAATVGYRRESAGHRIEVTTPGTDPAGAAVTVDADGFIVDCPGLATRL